MKTLYVRAVKGDKSNGFKGTRVRYYIQKENEKKFLLREDIYKNTGGAIMLITSDCEDKKHFDAQLERIIKTWKPDKIAGFLEKAEEIKAKYQADLESKRKEDPKPTGRPRKPLTPETVEEIQKRKERRKIAQREYNTAKVREYRAKKKAIIQG